MVAVLSLVLTLRIGIQTLSTRVLLGHLGLRLNWLNRLAEVNAELMPWSIQLIKGEAILLSESYRECIDFIDIRNNILEMKP